jgi:hypothetical protein
MGIKLFHRWRRLAPLDAKPKRRRGPEKKARAISSLTDPFLTQSQREAVSQRRRRGLYCSRPWQTPFDAKPKRRREPEKKARAIVLLDRPSSDANAKRRKEPEKKARAI